MTKLKTITSLLIIVISLSANAQTSHSAYYKKTFAKLDSNKDLNLTKEELGSRKWFVKNYSKIDTNSDGGVNLDEFVVFSENQRKEISKKKRNEKLKSVVVKKKVLAPYQTAFKKYDLNSDGKISKDETKKVKELRKVRRFDTDKNKTIEEKEFEGFYSKYLKK